MGKAMHVQPPVTLEESDPRLKPMTACWRIRRWLVSRHALVDPAPAQAMARRLGLSVCTGRDLSDAYNRHGPGALDTPGHGHRQRAYRSLAQARAVLAPFVAQRRPGPGVTIPQINTALAAT